MTVFLVRTTIFVVLPLLIAAAVNALDPAVRTRAQRLEVTLIFLFGLGVAGGGIGGAFGHFFLSDQVAEAIGWETGSPFQLEMGFANLALGVLGLIAVGRRDGFREATATAVAVISVGATIVHLVDIVQTGNLAPGNTLQNITNLAKPILLIAFLRAGRRADLMTEAAPPNLSARYGPAVGWMAATVSTGFGVGYALDRLVIATALGVLLGAAGVWFSVSRTHVATLDAVAP